VRSSVEARINIFVLGVEWEMRFFFFLSQFLNFIPRNQDRTFTLRKVKSFDFDFETDTETRAPATVPKLLLGQVNRVVDDPDSAERTGLVALKNRRRPPVASN